MLPERTRVLTDIEFDTMPSYTYAIDIENGRIGGFVDRHDAMRQAIYKILNTERYRYLAYSWDYGAELEDLFGKPIPYVCPEVQRRIEEALEWDDRILDVHDFSFDLSKRNVVSVSFTADTIFGDITIEQFHVIEPPLPRAVEKADFNSMLSQVRFNIDSQGRLTYSYPEVFDDYCTFDIVNGHLVATMTTEFDRNVKLNIDKPTGKLMARYMSNV